MKCIKRYFCKHEYKEIETKFTSHKSFVNYFQGTYYKRYRCNKCGKKLWGELK
jgi:hypothetical protein